MFTRPFSELTARDASIAGGKGASLGEMTRAGIPVPPGFVVVADAFERFLEETDLDAEVDAALDEVNHKEIHTVENASEKIQALIKSAKMPADIAREVAASFKKLGAKYVAVRSSATAEDSSSAAWAGQLDTFLNTTEKNLLEKVQACWASLFTPRAIFYRFEKDLHKQKISVAVVVQKMVESEKSGIAFSVHPVTEDRNQLIIEAGFGLGEAIVSGSVTPDSYVVEKEPRRIIDKNVSTQARALYRGKSGGTEWRELPKEVGETQALSDEEILEFAELVLQIERHYGFPCDIEWARENGKFYITQSRPITTLHGAPVAASEPTVINGKKWDLYITRNMPLWHDYPYIAGNYRNMGDFGVHSPLEILFICVDGTQTHFFVNKENQAAFKGAVLAAIASEKGIADLKKKYQGMAKRIFSALDACLVNIGPETWKKLAQELAPFYAGLNITVSIGRNGNERLTELLKDLHYTEERLPSIISVITYPSEHTPLFTSQLDMLKIGRDIQAGKLKRENAPKQLSGWLERHGYIPVNFCNDPWTLDDARQQLDGVLKKDCARELVKLEKSHQEKVKAAKDLLVKIGNKEVSVLAHAIQEGTYLNEFRKNAFSRVSWKVRAVFERVARLTGCAWRDCFYLKPEEIEQALGGTLKDVASIVAARRLVGFYPNESDETAALTKEDAEKLETYVANLHGRGTQAVEAGATTVTGFSANKGVIRGRVKIVLSAKDFARFEAGDILVTTMTSVDFVPIMEKAGAFVTNEGGITSHASIVAREMNKPCIIGTKIATQVLKDGDLVEVDADHGVVKILERGSNDILRPATGSESPTDGVLEEARKMKWEKWLERPQFSAFAISFFEDSSRRESFEAIGIPGVELKAQLCQNGNWYLNEKTLKEMDAQVEAYLDGHTMADVTGALNRFKEKSEKRIRRLITSRDPIEGRFGEVFGILRRAATYIWLAHGLESYYQRKLDEEVPRHIKHDVEKFIGDASFPKKKNAHAEFEEAMRKGIPDAEIARKFGWLKSRDFSGGFTPAEIRSMKQDLPPPTARAKVFIPKPLRTLFEQVQELVFFRTARTDVFYYLCFVSRPIIRELADTYGIASKEIDFYRAKSFIDGRVEKYDPKCSFLYLNGEVVFQNKLILPEEQFIESDKVKGVTAYRGNVRGNVRVVRGVSELDKVKSGDILVTQMTFPSFMPALIRAAAFVTDEGGITCHAAIVAREMQKPCIIGTKVATKTFKDGDLVEVDADHGVVKVLGKSTDAEIPKRFYDTNKNWIHYLTRPFNLFGASIWQAWYESPQMRKLFETDMEDILFIEEHPNIVRSYRVKEQWAKMQDNIERFAQEKKAYLERALKKGYVLNTKAEKVLKKGKSAFKNLEAALDFLIDNALHSTVLPHQAYTVIKDRKISADESILLSEKLRATSYYPKLTDTIVIPLAKEKLFGLGFKNSAEVLEVITLRELLALSKGKTKFINERLEKRKTGLRFVYQSLHGEESIHWIEENRIAELLMKLEKVEEADGAELKGQAAFLGKVRGVARVILNTTGEGARFGNGEILVSINSNPTLMPLLRKCGAIVTDEGGVACHAAIISRELKKPCVMGTKIATSLIRDGDLIEVDAYEGVVRIIKRENNQKL